MGTGVSAFLARRITVRSPAGGLPIIVVGVGLLLALITVAASIGTVGIAPAETLKIVLWHLHLPGGEEVANSAHDRIIWDVRLPRVLTAAMVGAALAQGGAAYQGVFRNPLADPFLLGVAAGAALGAVAVIVSPLPLDFYRFGTISLFAFIGGMGAVFLTYQIARVGWTVTPSAHILAGVTVSAAAAAATAFLIMMDRQSLSTAFSWLYGDFTSSSWPKLAAVLPFVALSSGLLLLFGRHLNALQLSEEEARTLGIPVGLIRAAIIILASLATAACVAISGLIGFVGLIVPHICRLLFGVDYRVLLPTSLIGGAMLLIVADLGARTILSPQEIPVGILTAGLGAPFFFYLLKRSQGALRG
jgi:iron complex transport system permease protein